MEEGAADSLRLSDYVQLHESTEFRSTGCSANKTEGREELLPVAPVCYLRSWLTVLCPCPPYGEALER